MELTPQQKRKLLSMLDIREKGDMAVLEKVLEFQDEVEDIKEEFSDFKEKTIAGVNEALSTIPTADEVAKLVQIPIVEKVIEKTEVIKELPMITNEVKEVAVGDTPEQTRDKLESLTDGEKLSIQAIQDLAEELKRLEDRIYSSSKGGGGFSSIAMQSKFIDDETPTGTINGSNQTFYLSNAPIPSSVKVYLGGVRLRVTQDYTLSGRTLTFTNAPQVGEILLADYRIV